MKAQDPRAKCFSCVAGTVFLAPGAFREAPGGPEKFSGLVLGRPGTPAGAQQLECLSWSVGAAGTPGSISGGLGRPWKFFRARFWEAPGAGHSIRSIRSIESHFEWNEWNDWFLVIPFVLFVPLNHILIGMNGMIVLGSIHSFHSFHSFH